MSLRHRLLSRIKALGAVAQIVAYEPAGDRPAPRPWSRAYQYRDEGPATLTTPLDRTRRDRAEQ